MSFDSYKKIAEVIQEYKIISTSENFIADNLTSIEVSHSFREELAFSIQEFVFEESEYAVCETIVFPILREIYKSYREKFTLWSHKSITYDEKLYGVPDYILAKRSPLGKEVFQNPFFVTIEAKKDDFVKGWGQGLAEMVAIQKMNTATKIKRVFGIVSNGQLWQFGQLTGNYFIKNIQAYTVYDLDKLLAAVDYIFSQCVLELEAIEQSERD